MDLKRRDYLPHYAQDLIEKINRVKAVIENLTDYTIDDISDVTRKEYEILKLAAINSIKGRIIAAEEKSRQQFVEASWKGFHNLLQRAPKNRRG